MENKSIVYEQFVRNFKENTNASNYYFTRKLSDKIINENLIGFCPLYTRYNFPLLRGRLIVPIHDINNNIIALAGRKIPSLEHDVMKSFWDLFGDDPAKCQEKINKWNKGKWINEPYQKTRNLFFLNKTKQLVAKKNYIVLVEGYFDAYGLYDNGIENVAAICGTSISDYQISLISRYCDNVFILMDSDSAGVTASNNISKKIENFGMNIYKVFLPSGFDPDEFAKDYDLSFFDSCANDMIINNKKELHLRH